MTDREELTAQVRKLAHEAGASLVGFADVEGLADLPQAVVIAIAHSPSVLADPENMPNIGYADEYDNFNQRLDEIANSIAMLLSDHGWQSLVNPSTSADIDVEKLTAPFSHKMAATRAGLGWIGKSALLVTPEFGPALRLVSLLTDAPLAVGKPITESRCGDCQVCVKSCPGRAIKGQHWQVGRLREELFDARICYETRTDAALRNRIQRPRCGVCLSVCPRRPR